MSLESYTWALPCRDCTRLVRAEAVLRSGTAMPSHGCKHIRLQPATTAAEQKVKRRSNSTVLPGVNKDGTSYCFYWYLLSVRHGNYLVLNPSHWCYVTSALGLISDFPSQCSVCLLACAYKEAHVSTWDYRNVWIHVFDVNLSIAVILCMIVTAFSKLVLHFETLMFPHAHANTHPQTYAQTCRLAEPRNSFSSRPIKGSPAPSLRTWHISPHF